MKLIRPLDIGYLFCSLLKIASTATTKKSLLFTHRYASVCQRKKSTTFFGINALAYDISDYFHIVKYFLRKKSNIQKTI